MRTLFRKIIWLAVSIGIIYGAYSWYVGWWNPIPQTRRIQEYATNVFNMSGDEAIQEVKQKAREGVEAVTDEVKQSTVGYIKEKTRDVFTTVGEEIINKAKDLFGITSPLSSETGTLQNLVIPPPTGPGFFVPPPTATISYGIGESFAISINRGSSYTVDWGSGTSESGETVKAGLTVLKHSWNQEGDYTVKVSVNDSGKTDKYIFPIRVYK